MARTRERARQIRWGFVNRLHYFDYNAVVEGENIQLDAIWKGQNINEWLKINVPEPGAAGLLAVTALVLLRRRWRADVALGVLAAVICAGSAQAEQGTVRWPAQQGMGYRLQRSAF